MREKVMALAQGKYTYEEPDIILSTKMLKLNVTEGGEASAVFGVKNSERTKIKGFCAVQDFNFEFPPVFDGKENEITVTVHAANKHAGDRLNGEITIITDCGESKLPYEVCVTGRYLQGGQELLKSYDEFVAFAKEHFEEAVPVFYHEKFRSIYLQTMGEKRLYQNLTMKNPKKQALEEFLVAHGDKKPVQYMVNKKQLSFDIGEEDLCGEFTVAKDSWGMSGIKVMSDHSFLSLGKSFLYEGDFVDNQAVVSFRICAGKVPAGIHRCRILLENVYQRLEISVRVHGVTGIEQRKKRRDEQHLLAAMTRCHIQYMMNSSLREQWRKMLVTDRAQILAVYPGNEMLLDGYISWLAKDENGRERFLNAVEGVPAPEPGEELEKVVRYLYSRYIQCRIRAVEEERQELYHTIKDYYNGGYRHWRLLILLERLGYFQGNSAGLLEELEALWEEGSFSPYLHFYRMMLLLQEPELLKRLDSRTVGALRFGLKHDLITEDLVIAVSFLAARKKNAVPALMALLQQCYDIFENKDTLHSICTLMIRSERLERKNFRWFRLGVENKLRITELFEYYMYTLGKERIDEALPVVMSFFQYENHLRDSVKVSFYASIVKNRDNHPAYFQIYQNAIREFTLRQLYEHRINRELAVLYETFLSETNIKDRIARELPYILFTYRLRCQNASMERVVVAHDEGGGEMVYNLTGGQADILLGTPNYKLYFVDKNGFYHADTVPYQIEKMLNLDNMAEACYENGSEHPVLLLHLFSKALASEQTGAKDAIMIHMMIRNERLGVEYTCQALLALYEYYKAIGEDGLLEEILSRIDFKYLPEERHPGILQTMIQHKMNDKALEVLRKYEITGGSQKLLLLLITWKLEESEGAFDPYYMQLCSFLYRKGVKNKTTLAYLVKYFMGSTAQLLKIYKDAGRQEAEIYDGGTERLLGQALFAAESPEKYFDIFLDYYEYGANRILVKAFLGYTAYEYLVGRCTLTDGVLEKIQKEGLSEDNPIMILAMLRYYAGKEEYTQIEKEYIEYHLSRYESTGKVFSFMKEFTGKVEVPFAIEHAGIIQFCCSRKGDVCIEIQDEQGEKLIQPMRRVFEDIYVYETLLFRGESLTYRIFAGDMEHPVQTGVLEKEEAGKDQGLAFYEMVNQMIEAREHGDTEQFDSLAELYKSRQKTAEKLFEPL